MNSIELAKTISEQINMGTDERAENGGRHLKMCWGYRNPLALPEKKIGEKLQLGGLMFQVSGLKFKGYVQVRLMACDTYTVVFCKKNKKAENGLKEFGVFESVYCEDLTRIIDSFVEK